MTKAKTKPAKKTVTIHRPKYGEQATGALNADDTRLGRPTGYRPEYARQAKILAQGGMTDFEIGEFFGVSASAISRWRAEYPEFRSAFILGEQAANARVERALFELACGYRCHETHVSNYQGNITLTPIIKHHPPNVAASIFWLKNRASDRWKLNPNPEDDSETPAPTKIVIEVKNARVRDVEPVDEAGDEAPDDNG